MGVVHGQLSFLLHSRMMQQLPLLIPLPTHTIIHSSFVPKKSIAIDHQI
jgi:hypothetical protein